MIGNVVFYDGREYVIISDVIKDKDDLEEKMNYQKILIGSFFKKGSLSEHLRALPYGLAEKNHYTILKFSLIEEGDIVFEAYREYDDVFYKFKHKLISIPDDMESIEEAIQINEEIAVFKEAERLLSFLSLSLLAGFFGIFGGVIGYILARKQTKKRRIALLLLGFLSTVAWYMIQYII